MTTNTPNTGAMREGLPPDKPLAHNHREGLPPDEPLTHNFRDLWTRGALFVAFLGVVGSLYLSLVMDLKACPLCFYQRAFMMAVAGSLAFGLFVHVPPATQSVLNLPAASGGGAIALWHSYLDWTGKLECPTGITGFLTAPQESLLVFVLVAALLFGELLHQRKFLIQGIAAVLIGIVFCITCVDGVHKDPISPTGPIDGCRKVAPEKK